MKGDSSSVVAKKSAVLPWELIIEILLRLPVKSLVRFKCVSKSWLSLLSDPHFATSLFAKARRDRLLFITPSATEIRSIDLNASLHDDSASAVLKPNFVPPKTYHNLQIIGSSRGFVLLNSCQSLWLWNPSTGFHRQVSCSPIDSNMHSMFIAFLYGFGYDSSTDDYLVVKASYNPIYRNCTTRVEFFSLRANVWEDIEASHLSYADSSGGIRARTLFNGGIRAGTLFNDAIHWLAFSCHVSAIVIVAFDLTDRSFSDMSLPLPLLVDFEGEFEDCDLGVLGDLLCLSAVGWNRSVEIWVMEKYRVQSSWTKTIVVSVDDIPVRYFFLVCATKEGDIVGTDGSAGLAKCNHKGRLREHRSYCNTLCRSQVAVYTESLLSLP